jgi:hypothetical protein
MKTSAPKFKVNAVIDSSTKPEEGAVWFFYPLARSTFVTKHPELYERQSGFVVPLFEEEFQGRWILADSCAQHLQEGKAPPSTYLADLLRVHQAGFLSEYVWWFLCQPSWPAEQQPANLLTFMACRKDNLHNHNVKTHGGIQIVREESGKEASSANNASRSAAGRVLDIKPGGGGELNSQVAAIGGAVQRKAVDEVLSLFGVFHVAVQNLRKEGDAVYVCFQSQRELNYFIASQPDFPKVRVLDWCVAWGMFLKAFALSKAGRFGEALEGVEEAAKLAPLYAHAQVEKGYILNRLHRTQEALAAYTRAWELAARLPENLDFAGAALRGQAVAWVELGDLDRAEKLLRDSLVVEPDNPVANHELTYIALRRSGNDVQVQTGYSPGTV